MWSMQDSHSELTLVEYTGNAASEEPTKEKRESDETQNKVDASNIGAGNDIQTVSGTLLVRNSFRT